MLSLPFVLIHVHVFHQNLSLTLSPLSPLSIKLLKLFRLGQSTLRGQQLYSEPYLGYPANERYPLNVST